MLAKGRSGCAVSQKRTRSNTSRPFRDPKHFLKATILFDIEEDAMYKLLLIEKNPNKLIDFAQFCYFLEKFIM